MNSKFRNFAAAFLLATAPALTACAASEEGAQVSESAGSEVSGDDDKC